MRTAPRLNTAQYALLASALASIALGASACTAPLAAPGETVGSASEPVEQGYEVMSGTFGFENRSPANYAPLAATGVLYTPFRTTTGALKVGQDGTPLRGTCGVTFISSHYAITASHCVAAQDVPTPATTMLQVQQFDMSGVPLSDWELAGNGGAGSFPNYSFNQLTSAQGYKTTTYNSCHVVQSCSSTYGRYNCAANEEGDIAVIRCDDRPWFTGALPVATSDALTGPVTMEWYHEVINMPTTSPTLLCLAGPLGAACRLNYDHYAHYTQYPPNDPNEAGSPLYSYNFHYYGGGRNQLLALTTGTWRIGDLFEEPSRTGYDSTNKVVWTDLFGCHGTSGSGVLQEVVSGSTVSYQLLGPVALGNFTGLCVDATTHQQHQSSIGYTPVGLTQYAAQIAAGDYFHIPFPIHF